MSGLTFGVLFLLVSLSVAAKSYNKNKPERHFMLPPGVLPETPIYGRFPTFPATYSYCGDNTYLHDRLHQGYRGVNKLDSHCLLHDLHYLTASYLTFGEGARKKADKVLVAGAQQVLADPTTFPYEKSDALHIIATFSNKKKSG